MQQNINLFLWHSGFKMGIVTNKRDSYTYFLMKTNCAYHPAIPGSSPKHTIYAFFI